MAGLAAVYGDEYVFEHGVVCGAAVFRGVGDCCGLLNLSVFGGLFLLLVLAGKFRGGGVVWGVACSLLHGTSCFGFRLSEQLFL